MAGFGDRSCQDHRRGGGGGGVGLTGTVGCTWEIFVIPHRKTHKNKQLYIC